jgi:hypothetical protein
MPKPTFSLQGISVFIGMPARGAIPVPTVSSLLNTTAWMDQNDVPNFTSIVGGGTICSARCQIAKAFLEGNCNRLVFIDSDMVWATEEFIRLIALSSKLDIVAGAYQGRFDPPHFYLRSPDDVPSPDKLESNEYGCIKMAGVGLGFTVVSRTVIEKLAKQAPIIKFRDDDILPEIFRFDKDEHGQFRGEDMNFFDDARKAGFDLWVEPKITLGHIGDKIYNASLMDKHTVVSPTKPEMKIAS